MIQKSDGEKTRIKANVTLEKMDKSGKWVH